MARTHTQPRPLSPHLGIYRLTVTMAMSIAHRITGIALYAGHFLIVAWLVAMAATPGAYDVARAIAISPLGLIVLFLYSWALFHHMMGGIRHFVWDTGHGLDHPMRDYLAWGTLIGGVVATVLFWIIVLIAI
jgi:succinate dehydrogenase / fumarate reductase cytochrome b subunit